MKSHDFGQFLFNSSIFNEGKIVELITAAKDSVPNLATGALFLRLISFSELAEQKNPEEYLQKILTDSQMDRITALEKDNSLKLVQTLLDTSTVDLEGLEEILQKYHRVEIPPVESAFASFFDSIQLDDRIDYPLALSVAESLHEFLSETLKTSIIFVPSPELGESENFGASVKITGDMPVVVAVMADREVFHRMANIYDDFVSDDLDEDFDAMSEINHPPTDKIIDAMSEMLNVFTGNFTVQFAAAVGVEEEPEPPRFGRVDDNISALRVLTNFGIFYLYIEKKEIFSMFE